jgi:hypothetical protein
VRTAPASEPYTPVHHTTFTDDAKQATHEVMRSCVVLRSLVPLGLALAFGCSDVEGNALDALGSGASDGSTTSDGGAGSTGDGASGSTGDGATSGTGDGGAAGADAATSAGDGGPASGDGGPRPDATTAADAGTTGADAGARDSGPAPSGCACGSTCGSLACVEGQCVACQSDLDCCAPFACLGGQCLANF